ncbi:MAG: flagellar export chaperone FliS [Desulfovibrionaceae bacterium]
MHKAAHAYFQTQVTTTSQGELLLMLYDAAIKFLGQAKVHINNKDYAKKGILISKAIDIISELAQSLNKEQGGDLAQNLHQLYFYCSSKLLKANLRMDLDILDEVIQILSGLRSAFAEIIPQQEGKGGGVTSQAKTENQPARPQPQNGPQTGGLKIPGKSAGPAPDKPAGLKSPGQPPGPDQAASSPAARQAGQHATPPKPAERKTEDKPAAAQAQPQKPAPVTPFPSQPGSKPKPANPARLRAANAYMNSS